MQKLTLRATIFLLYCLGQVTSFSVENYKLWDQSIDLSGCQVSASDQLVSFLCDIGTKTKVYISDIDAFYAQEWKAEEFYEDQVPDDRNYTLNSHDNQVVAFHDVKAFLFEYTPDVGFERRSLKLQDAEYINIALFGYYVVTLQLIGEQYTLQPYDYQWNAFSGNDIAVDKEIQGFGQITSDSDLNLFFFSYRKSSEYFADIWQINSPLYFNKTIALGADNCAENIRATDFLIVASCPSYNNSMGLISVFRIQDNYELLTLQGSSAQGINIGRELEIIKKPTFDLEEIILFSSEHPATNTGSIGTINVYHDRRQTNFTYLSYEFESITNLDEVLFGSSIGSNNNGDIFILSRNSSTNSTAHTLLCSTNEYYSDGQCRECSTNNSFSSTSQSSQCNVCENVDSMDERSLTICDYQCGPFEFGKNCLPCESYKESLNELTPSNSMWDNTQSEVCTYKCALGYMEIFDGCEADGTYPYDEEKKLPNEGNYHTLFQCSYYSDCNNCAYNPECSWCPSTSQCFNVTTSDENTCSDVTDLKDITEPWYESLNTCPRTEDKCENPKEVLIHEYDRNKGISFSSSLEINDFCSWKFTSPTKSESQYYHLEVFGTLEDGQLILLSEDGETLLQSIDFQEIQTLEFLPEVTSFVAYYRSNINEANPSFNLVVTLIGGSEINKMIIYLPIIGFLFLAGVGITVYFFIRNFRKHKLTPMDQLTVKFGEEQYKKYMMKNHPDEKTSSKIQKAFMKMEEVQFNMGESAGNMMTDIGKCVTCKQHFQQNENVTKMCVCVHMYHGECLEDYIVNGISMDQAVKCPSCDKQLIE